MDRFPVTRTRTVVDATSLVGTTVPALAATITDAGVYVDTDTHEPAFAYLPVDRLLVHELRASVVGYRCVAVQRNADYVTRSTTFGYSPRAAINLRDGCRASQFMRDEVAREAVLDRTANALQKMMIDIDPGIVNRDSETLNVIERDWFIGDTDLWTSGVINQSSTLPYHRDRFNFPTWSAMPVLRRGMDGGHLHIPEYDATIACRDGHAVFFAGHDLVHGVTPMRPRVPDAYRYSIVYYALRGMKDCHTAAAETAYARVRRTEREISMAAKLQTAPEST
jgi:hypothetical protein